MSGLPSTDGGKDKKPITPKSITIQQVKEALIYLEVESGSESKRFGKPISVVLDAVLPPRK